ncbi:MAG: GNAT family N-acetyltransferase [Planctomycetes bacterium]|nr:GNAT family N-acetyltransferase [Planctomycetota bacterium]
MARTLPGGVADRDPHGGGAPRRGKEARFGVGTWHGTPSPYLALEGSWDSYRHSLKSKLRQNLRNRERRLAAEGELKFQIYRAAGEGMRGALEDSLEIEASSWKGTQGSAIRQDNALLDFYRAWLEVAAQEGWLRLGMLRVSGRPVAFDLSVAFAGTQFCLKIGFERDFAAFSPGQLLCQEMLRRCFEEECAPPLREYDFLGGVTPQKLDWTGSLREVGWIHLYRRNLRGWLVHALKFRLAPIVRRHRT